MLIFSGNPFFLCVNEKFEYIFWELFLASTTSDWFVIYVFYVKRHLVIILLRVRLWWFGAVLHAVHTPELPVCRLFQAFRYYL